LQRHALQAWQTLGLPDGLQLDNDAAVTGGERTPRRFSAFVRLCLYLGIELVFVPPHEPQRNGVVESLNGLWARSFWERDHFGSFAEVVRKSPTFTRWYMDTYCPPALQGLTPAQAYRRVRRPRLTPQQVRALPAPVPLTAGQLHFLRRVSGDGVIRFLGEIWKVSRSLAHQYVRATVLTQAQRLEIYHHRAGHEAGQLVKQYPYELPEPVHPLHPALKH
jgi:putative transposase